MAGLHPVRRPVYGRPIRVLDTAVVHMVRILDHLCGALYRQHYPECLVAFWKSQNPCRPSCVNIRPAAPRPARLDDRHISSEEVSMSAQAINTVVERKETGDRNGWASRLGLFALFLICGL